MHQRPKTALMGLIATSALLMTPPPAEAQRANPTTAGALPAEEPEAGYDRASCVLMLKGSLRNPGFNPTAFADLTALTTAMSTTGLIDPAAKAALGLGPREWRKAVLVEIIPAGTQAVKLAVSVDPKQVDDKHPDPADSLMRELIARAKGVINQSVEPRRQELKARLDELEKRRAEARATVEALRKRMREAEPTGMPGNFGFATNQRRMVETELAGKRARLLAVKELAPKLAAQDDQSVALKGLVESREALVAGLEKAVEQGKADPLDVLRARADLAEARVRATEAGRVPGPPQPRGVRDDRLNLEVEVASLEAQLKALPDKPADPARPEEAQSIRSELFRAEGENNNIEQQFQQARRDFEQFGPPPTLVVLDGKDSD